MGYFPSMFEKFMGFGGGVSELFLMLANQRLDADARVSIGVEVRGLQSATDLLFAFRLGISFGFAVHTGVLA